jgi:hypothetical protein
MSQNNGSIIKVNELWGGGQMMTTIEASCPFCGATLEPRVFSVNSAPLPVDGPGVRPAFLVGLFLVCPNCEYMEEFKVLSGAESHRGKSVNLLPERLIA